MIPWYYAVIAFAVGLVVGIGLTLFWLKPKYDALAEEVEQLGVQTAQLVANQAQGIADKLKQPGK